MDAVVERILFTEADIRARVNHVAREVAAYYQGEPCTVVAVLKGGCVFAADLIRKLPMPLSLSFAAASSYRDGTTSGALKLTFLPPEPEIRGRRILLVDDILDTGRTAAALCEKLLAHGAHEVKTCVLLDKPSRRVVACRADFCCFDVADVFIVGYGLDFAGRYRNLPYIGVLRPEGAEAVPVRPEGEGRRSSSANEKG